MKWIERIRLLHRAGRYRYRNDKGEIAYLRAAVKKGDTVFDIGAHKAGYLYHMLKRTGRNGQVVAFEPQISLYNYLIKLKEWFNWGNVTIKNLALSDIAGKVKLYIPSGNDHHASSPGASILKLSAHQGNLSVEEVESDTLDAFCSRHNFRPDFIKIDVEGNELRIIRGGMDIIRECMPKILMEIEARHVGRDEVYHTIEVMENMGYQGYFVQGMTRRPVGSFDVDIHQEPGARKNYCNNFIFEKRH
jgi:FkbM family methyltransferase